MYTSNYKLQEIARVLKRSVPSLVADIERGRLPARARMSGRMRGGRSSLEYSCSLRDLENYLGSRVAQRLFSANEQSSGNRWSVETETKRYTKRSGIGKRCRSCGRLMLPGNFDRDYRFADCLSPVCKECIKRLRGY